jgi:two-component system CheB/CheR fusion protein
MLHGRKSHVYLSVKYPLRDERGRIFAIAGICSDITRRKRAERRAHDSVRQRDRFLAMLSHELRNPLAAIQSASLVMDRLPTSDAPMRKACDIVRRQTGQMGRLLDDLLDISRVTQGKIELRQEVIDLRREAEQAILAVRSTVTARELELNVRLAEEPLYVHGDAVRLQQVQVNLLVNAAKYTPAGGEIDFQLEREQDQAVIRVRDTGVGMSKKLQRRAFDPFVQGNETLQHSEGGMGLGLTLVKSLVEMHGGTIRVASDGPGRGAEFVVGLPLTRKAPPSPNAKDESDDALPDTTHLKLLVVEDNEDAREMLRMLLESYGYEVGTAEDGISALTAIEAAQPDVAFVDIGLPEMDGYDVARRIRTKHIADDTRLVALTGYGQSSNQSKAREAGFDHHLTKPVNMDRLRGLLEEVATKRTQQA